jgi:hypothetical protein
VKKRQTIFTGSFFFFWIKIRRLQVKLTVASAGGHIESIKGNIGR